jgi:hypothetical protein
MQSIRCLAALTSLFTAQCALAQVTPWIRGKVTDSSGAPILGAVVTVSGADGNSRVTVTDIEGAFQISSLPPGNYSVKIAASGLSGSVANRRYCRFRSLICCSQLPANSCFRIKQFGGVLYFATDPFTGIPK